MSTAASDAHEAAALAIVEGVEQAGVDDRREAPPEPFEGEGVVDEELDLEAARERLAPRGLDGRLDRVDAHDLEAAGGEEQGVLAGPAADVEHRSGDLTGVGERLERGLRPPDVPRRRALVGFDRSGSTLIVVHLLSPGMYHRANQP